MSLHSSIATSHLVGRRLEYDIVFCWPPMHLWIATPTTRAMGAFATKPLGRLSVAELGNSEVERDAHEGVEVVE